MSEVCHRGKPPRRVQDPARCCLKPFGISDDSGMVFLRRACVHAACLPDFPPGGCWCSTCHCTPRSLAMPWWRLECCAPAGGRQGERAHACSRMHTLPQTVVCCGLVGGPWAEPTSWLAAASATPNNSRAFGVPDARGPGVSVGTCTCGAAWKAALSVCVCECVCQCPHA